MPLLEGLSFTAPPSEHEFSALLFDMDGTIIDSTAAIVKYWRGVGKDIGVDGDLILQTSHGRRSIDVLSQWAPHLANWEHIVPMEASIPIKYGSSAIEIPGSRTLLSTLSSLPTPFPIWAIVTSGTSKLVQGWFEVMKLTPPPVLVSAEEVEKGKPDPGCYLLGEERLLGLRGKEEETGGGERERKERRRVLVLEDAPAGIRAGKAAGFEVLAVATTHEVGELKAAGADWVVRDLRSVKVKGWEGKEGNVKVEIVDGLVLEE